MTFVCAHQGFSDAVNDPDHGLIARGTVMSTTQSSICVRATTETQCNGFTFEPGKLRDFDLAFFGRNLPPQVSRPAQYWSRERGIILYRFFHYRARTRVEHGWVVTSTDHQLIRSFFTGPTWKSMDVIANAILEITKSPDS